LHRRIVLHPSTAPVSVTRTAEARRVRGEARTDPLTPREIEILTMMAEGTSNRAIARQLEISPHTVKFHIASILDKLDARSRTHAVIIRAAPGLADGVRASAFRHQPACARAAH
jgi:DNA-binding NarL/FixJ family response regulator